MFAALLVVATVQFDVDLGKVMELAAKAAPEAKWSWPKGVAGGSLLIGRREYKLNHELSARAAQGPAQVVLDPSNPTVYENEQVFVVDIGTPAPKWIPYEPLKHSNGVFKVDLGEGHKQHWFARGSLAFIDSLKRSAKLRGGDDLLQIASDTLRSKNVEGVTYGTAYTMLVRAKDASLPYLRKEIAASGSKAPAIAILGQIRTSKAGYELLRIYKHGDKHERSAVKSAAAYKPTLQMLKPVYRDLLNEGEAVVASTEAAIQYGWSDFLPAVKRQWQKTHNPLEALVLYEAMDVLGPRKLPISVVTAAHHLRDSGYRPEMQAEFVGCPDPIYRGLLAHQMLGYATKAGFTLRPRGEELLETVPDNVQKQLQLKFR